MLLPFNAVILTYPRSGTHMLQSSLAKHPDIFISNEIFQPRYSSKEIVGGGLERVLEHWFGNAPADKVKVAVIHLTHAKPDDEMTTGTDCYKIWNQLYNDTGVKILMLRRASYLRRYVSHRISGLSDVFNIYSEKQRPTEKIHVDPLAYFENIMRTDQLYRETLANLQDHTCKMIWYEQLTGNFNSEMSDVFGFLGVDDIQVKPDTIQKEVRDIETVIENYAELKDFFQAHPYALY